MLNAVYPPVRWGQLKFVNNALAMAGLLTDYRLTGRHLAPQTFSHNSQHLRTGSGGPFSIPASDFKKCDFLQKTRLRIIVNLNSPFKS